MASSDTRVDSPPASRARWLVVWVVVCVVVAVLAFFAGMTVRSPWDEATANSRARPVVTAEVVALDLESAQSRLTGVVSLGRDELVSATAPVGVTRAVVTAPGAEVGDALESGVVVAFVSDRPVVALDLPFPLYRDIERGMSGIDVHAIQEALNALGLLGQEPDGKYDAETARAIGALYERIGSTPPRPLSGGSDSSESDAPAGPGDAAESTVRLAEILPLTDVETTVVSVAPVGTPLDAGEPLAVLRMGRASVSARVGVADLGRFAVGSEHVAVDAAGTGQEVDLVTASIGEFEQEPNEQGDPPGRTVTFHFSEGVPFAEGSEVQVMSESGQGGISGLAVPLVALREDPGGAYVETVPKDPSDGDLLPVRVDVQVLGTGQGMAVVESADLLEGDRVVVSTSA